MGFFDFLVWMLWFYLVILCVWTFIWIFIDVFRDSSLSGWGKAGWVILLIVLPFLGALIYLIARGGSMAQRQAAQAHAAAQANADYVRSVAGVATSPSAEIERAQGLLSSGAISQSEFDALKAKALAA
ncbi:PLDc N-terminal domain-containing protein [Microbacterium sp. NPDC056234]|uniref:PLDc N-terminal domain-containing protein n=1 Tax=Microbacterium sp. NPDC056234 TaxID=3345757 RepID=UPI0035D987F1